MQNEPTEIANRVRGVAAENRVNQERLAAILKLSKSTLSTRMNGGTAFYAHELFALATEFDVDVSRFFPERSAERVAS